MPKCADLFTTGISFSFHKICVSFIKLSVSSTSYSESSQLGTCIELTSVLDAVCGTEVLFCAYSLFENDELGLQKKRQSVCRSRLRPMDWCRGEQAFTVQVFNSLIKRYIAFC